MYGEMHRYIPVLAKWAGFKKIGEKVVEHQRKKIWQIRNLDGDVLSMAFLILLRSCSWANLAKRPMHFFGLWGTVFFWLVLDFCLSDHF